MGICSRIHATADRWEAPEGLPDARITPCATSTVELFEARAHAAPNSLALLFENQALSFHELNGRSNQLAWHLRRHGITTDSIVALRTVRSVDMVVGLLGILKAGGAYLPIDPTLPAERQRFMLADAGARCLLTQDGLPPLQTTVNTLQFGADADRIANELIEDPASTLTPDSLAYVLYTSGSTGKPKGVAITHGNLLHSTTARFKYYRQPVGNFLLVSSFAFDSSAAGIFWTLCDGGTLTLPREYSQQTAHELPDLVTRHNVSHLLCLPSLYAVLLEQAAQLQTLRVVIVAGESCPPGLVRRHQQLLPRAVLFNEYGPTEATVWSTVHRCEDSPAGRRVPIGRPIPGTAVHILDQNLSPVPAGTPGELYIGGPGIARGYVNRPDLTAARFIPDPFLDPALLTHAGGCIYRTGDLARSGPDGLIEYLGREDHQVKILGHRIELDEVEAALREHPSVQDAVVIARKPAAPQPVNGEVEPFLLRRLAEMPPGEVEQVLAEIEKQEGASEEPLRREFPEFEATLKLKSPAFIRPPRDSQRSWLLNRTLDEFSEDLKTLDALAQRFVPGVEPDLAALTKDRAQAELTEQEILEDWHIPLMKAMARAVTATSGDILEIGFGRGIASTFLQECGIRSHTIVECNESVIRRFFEPWHARHSGRDIRLVRGRWQEVLDRLGNFDGIFFQTFPLNEREFAELLGRTITFAEHFIPVAAAHLRPGGAFTYLTHEIDSLGRRHQRLILRHFSSVTLSVEPLQLPPDCTDWWWADSMVVVKAVK